MTTIFDNIEVNEYDRIMATDMDGSEIISKRVGFIADDVKKTNK